MKKVFGLALIGIASTALLCSCSKKVVSSGVVDCNSVSVSSEGKSVFSANYSKGMAPVYEYKNTEDEVIYSSIDKTYYSNSIKMYNNDYDENNYETYYYSEFIGYLLVETNCYLDLDKNVIEIETIYSQYPVHYSGTADGEETDNDKAFECAKQGYYTNLEIIKGKTEKGLVRKTYVKLGDDSVISYQVK